MTQRVADLMVEILAQAGAQRCYGIVGDTLNYFTDAIHKSKKLEWVHMRHEEAGAFAAGADALLTGQLAVCAGSCGPGSLHFINGIFESNRNRSPLVLIASQLGTPQLGTQFPQEVDFLKVYSECTVFAQQINHPSEARRILTQACQAALNKRGVALVVVPVDVSSAEVPEGLPFNVHVPQPVVRPSDTELQAMAQLLTEGKKVAIYCGSGVEGAHDELIALACKLKAPIGHTSRAKDFVEYDNPFNMGMTGLLGISSGYEMMEQCDTLLLLGADFAWSQFYPNKARIIQVDKEVMHLGRRHPVDLGVVGDIVPTLQALLPLLTEKTDDSFLQTCLKHREHALKTLEAQERVGKGDVIHPQHVYRVISELAAEDAIIAADCGSSMAWLLRHLKVNGKRRTLTSMLHGTMANAMPQALGAQKAFPGRQVISVSGDGGLAMLMGDLITTLQEKLPIKIVVLNNGSLNFVELEQKVDGLLNNYTDLVNPDFGAVAQALGIWGRSVRKADEVEAGVRELLAQPGPGLLSVHTSPFELVMPPTVQASQVVSTTLYAAKALISGRAEDVEHLLVDNYVK